MVSEYLRGWEDALDVVLHLGDLIKVEQIREQIREEKICILKEGPI